METTKKTLDSNKIPTIPKGWLPITYYPHGILAYTDYVIVEFGDAPGLLAPVRTVLMTDYDGKYVTCTIQDIKGDYVNTLIGKKIKGGYMYSEEGRFGKVTQIPNKILSKLDK